MSHSAHHRYSALRTNVECSPTNRSCENSFTSHAKKQTRRGEDDVKESVEYETFSIFSIKKLKGDLRGSYEMEIFIVLLMLLFIYLYLLESSDRCGRESLELTDSQVRNGKHVHSLNFSKTSMCKMGIDQNSSRLLCWVYWSPCKGAGLAQTSFYFYFVSFLTVFFLGAQKWIF